MRRPLVSGVALVCLAMLISLVGQRAPERAAAQEQKSGSTVVLPIFEVDARFPTMPERMLLGGVGGATADSHGNVWVFHRPHTLEEGNATENGYVPGPPVMYVFQMTRPEDASSALTLPRNVQHGYCGSAPCASSYEDTGT